MLVGVPKEIKSGEARVGVTPGAASEYVAHGHTVLIEAGCDRQADSCRLKFENLRNFRGFPDIPGEDWLMSYPVKVGVNDGGSRR